MGNFLKAISRDRSRGSVEKVQQFESVLDKVAETSPQLLNQTFLSRVSYRLAKTIKEGSSPAPNVTKAYLRLASKISSQMIPHVDAFSPIDIANTAWAFAVLEHRDPLFLEKLAGHVTTMVDYFNQQDLVNTFVAFAKLRFYDRPMCNALCRHSRRTFQILKCMDVADVVWSCATLGHSDPELLEASGNRLVEHNYWLPASRLGPTIWAFDELKYLSKPLLEALVSRSLIKADSIEPYAFATIFSVANRKEGTNHPFHQALCIEAAKKIESCSAKEITSMVQSYRDHQPLQEPLLSAAKKRAHGLLNSMSVDDLSLMARGFSLAGVRDVAFFADFKSRVKERLADFTPKPLIGFMRVMTDLGMCDDDLAAIAADIFKQRAPECNSKQISNALWVYGSLMYRDQSLIQAMRDRAMDVLDEMSPQSVSNIAWSLATLAHHDERLFDALCSKYEEDPSAFSRQDISNLAWACGVLHPELVTRVINPEHLQDEDLAQIDWLQRYQALLVSGAIRPDFHHWRIDFIAKRHENSGASSFEQDVERYLIETLKHRNYSLRSGQMLGGAEADWELTYEDRRIIIECDISAYHTLNGPDGACKPGGDIIQDRTFSALGYEVIRISAKEWEATSDKARFIRERLGS